MAEYLIVRVGSNAANQAGRRLMGVAIVEAETGFEAVQTASADFSFTVYANQSLYASREDDLSETECELWNEFVETQD